MVGTKPATKVVGGYAAPKEVAALNIAMAPPRPPLVQVPLVSPTLPAFQPPPAVTTFKTIGYVEKAGGQLEAIILQENQVQVVHIGEYIAGRYLVTKITPDLVEAVDETLVQPPMAKPGGIKSDLLATNVAAQPSGPPSAASIQTEGLGVAEAGAHPATTQALEPVANSVGYVQQADGKVEDVVADGDSVRLIPETPAPSTMAQVTPPADLQRDAPSTQGYTPPVAPISSTIGAKTDHSMFSGRRPEGSDIRQASYQVPRPALSAADSAGSRYRVVSPAGVADAVENLCDPTTPISTAKPVRSTERLTRRTVEMKPLGFVEKADGEFAAILSQDDEIYIVRRGDRFADRYRALSVSADAVEAEEEPPRLGVPLPFAAPPAFPDVLSASPQRGSSSLLSSDCLGCNPNELGEISGHMADPPARGTGNRPVSVRGRIVQPAKNHGQDSDWPGHVDQATFIFQTLGYVQTQDGELQAIVADGPRTSLVKQGETFADHYRATSVDPLLVLAVKLPSGQDGGDFLSAQTESGDKSASKSSYGYLQSPYSDGACIRPRDSDGNDICTISGTVSGQTFHRVDALGSPVFADLGVDLFDSAPTGLALQSHFFMADNPKVGF